MVKITYTKVVGQTRTVRVWADGVPTPYTVWAQSNFYDLYWKGEPLAAGYSEPTTAQGKQNLHETLKEIATKSCVKAKYQDYYVVEKN